MRICGILYKEERDEECSWCFIFRLTLLHSSNPVHICLSGTYFVYTNRFIGLHSLNKTYECILFTFFFLHSPKIEIHLKSVLFFRFKNQNSSQYVPQGCNHLHFIEHTVTCTLRIGHMSHWSA